MPTIGTLFEQIAIDLIGLIYPASHDRHKYILIVVDYSIRYPEAIVLRNVTCETVSEALLKVGGSRGQNKVKTQ